MQRNLESLEQSLEMTAVKAAAAASKTPFTTAFKITLGIAAAQLVAFASFVCIAGLAIGVMYFILRY